MNRKYEFVIHDHPVLDKFLPQIPLFSLDLILCGSVCILQANCSSQKSVTVTVLFVSTAKLQGYFRDYFVPSFGFSTESFPVLYSVGVHGKPEPAHVTTDDATWRPVWRPWITEMEGIEAISFPMCFSGDLFIPADAV